MKTISIVMTYHNRKQVVINTLNSIKQYNIDPNMFEIIIVDDASNNDNLLDNIISKFPMKISLMRIEPEHKYWFNPCVPYNIGFAQAKNDIIIIQNAEVLHYNNIIKYTMDNIQLNDYFSFGCYSINKTQTEKIDYSQNNIRSIIEPFENVFMRLTEDGTDRGWCNHPVFRPKAYHFISAIHRKDLCDLGGFDERYADGIAYDDDEFITRIQRKGMNVKFIMDHIGIHQYHNRPENVLYDQDEEKSKKIFWEKYRQNEKLYKEVTLLEKEYKINVERRIFTL